MLWKERCSPCVGQVPLQLPLWFPPASVPAPARGSPVPTPASALFALPRDRCHVSFRWGGVWRGTDGHYLVMLQITCVVAEPAHQLTQSLLCHTRPTGFDIIHVTRICSRGMHIYMFAWCRLLPLWLPLWIPLASAPASAGFLVTLLVSDVICHVGWIGRGTHGPRSHTPCAM